MAGSAVQSVRVGSVRILPMAGEGDLPVWRRDRSSLVAPGGTAGLGGRGARVEPRIPWSKDEDAGLVGGEIEGSRLAAMRGLWVDRFRGPSCWPSEYWYRRWRWLSDGLVAGVGDEVDVGVGELAADEADWIAGVMRRGVGELQVGGGCVVEGAGERGDVVWNESMAGADLGSGEACLRGRG